MNIEVEIRSFISEGDYQRLLKLFKDEGEFLGEDYQETYYFDAKEDLRIQKNNNFSKIWMKKGKIHDESREELEIRFPKEDFEKLEKLFTSVGFNTKIKWFRTRNTFNWQGISVMLDFTKGYGYIIELEKMSDEENKSAALELLKEKLASLGIGLTPREEFDQKFKNYEANWKELTK